MKTTQTDDNRTAKRQRRAEIEGKTGACSYCGPHRGENRTYKKHGVKKPKYKTAKRRATRPSVQG